MKKWTALLLALVLCLSLCACGSSKSDADGAEKEDAEPEKVMKTDTVAIDAIAVDDSYRDKDESPLRIVYLFYTLTPQDANMSISSNSVKMTINDGNEYTAEHFDGCADPLMSYYYASYIEDVYVGSELKVCATFKIPEGDLTAGKTIKLSYDEVEDLAKMDLTTDDVQHFDGVEAIAKAIDPDGLDKWTTGHEAADDETAARVKEAINGYYWDFYVNNTSYEIEFMDPNLFEVRVKSLGVTNGGTYEILKDYIRVTYDSNGQSIDIPYSWGADDIELETADAFDIYM